MKKVVPDKAVLIPDTATPVFAGKIFDVYQWPQTLFDGSVVTFEMLRRPDTVVAICIVGDKLLVLQDEQSHAGLQQHFPGGRMEKGEDTLAAAQREVAEETGYTFHKWRLLAVRQPEAKIEWFIYVYLAWDMTAKGDAQPDAGEKITAELLPLAEVKRLAAIEASDMAESRALLEGCADVSALLTLPTFAGQEIDR